MNKKWIVIELVFIVFKKGKVVIIIVYDILLSESIEKFGFEDDIYIYDCI